MRRFLPLLCLALAVVALPATSDAQRLRHRIAELFFFGDPLSGGSAGTHQHGTHTLPSSTIANSAAVGFLGSTMANAVANVPIGATTSGETFRFEGGVPYSTATSAGPIFAERGQTLGRGRILAGLNRSSFRFTTLRGRPLSDIQIALLHENVDYEGCDAENGGQDCSLLGVPAYENDLTRFALDLDLAVNVTTFYTTIGITDHIDFGVVIPMQQIDFVGTNFAQIEALGGAPASHFFGGTPTNPVLQATTNARGSAFGVGDVAARLKINAFSTENSAVALMADARFPTGDVDDMLGLGHFVLRSQAIISSRFGAFSPHLNTGFVYRAGEARNHALLATAGFDHLLGPRVTLALDVVGEFQVGGKLLDMGGPVTFEAPFRRIVNPSSIPDMRDDVINGSVGFKFAPTRSFMLVTNAMVPLNTGGMRASHTWTLGLEYAF